MSGGMRVHCQSLAVVFLPASLKATTSWIHHHQAHPKRPSLLVIPGAWLWEIKAVEEFKPEFVLLLSQHYKDEDLMLSQYKMGMDSVGRRQLERENQS